jgi:hypothetical protein
MLGTGIEGRACFDNLPRVSTLGSTRLVRTLPTLELSSAFLCHRSVAVALQCIRVRFRGEHFPNVFPGKNFSLIEILFEYYLRYELPSQSPALLLLLWLVSSWESYRGQFRSGFYIENPAMRDTSLHWLEKQDETFNFALVDVCL